MFSRVDAARANDSASRPTKRQKANHPTDGPTTRSKRARMMTEETPAALPATTTDIPAATEAPEIKNHSVMEPHLESMRGLLTCKICQHYLTEPYGLACGHTYCYICLDTWIISQKKRSCPECRAAIRQQPAPSLILRELANMFFTNIELLGDEENVEELRKYAQEAAEKVAKDKAESPDGNLFKGVFNYYHGEGPIYDAEDNIHRCPHCSHEVLNDMCTHCGHTFSDEEDLDFDLEDMIDDEHGFDMDLLDHEHLHDLSHRHMMRHMRRGARRGIHGRRGHPQVVNLDSEEDSDSEDDEDGSEMDDFIDRDDGFGMGSDESSGEESTLSEQHRRLAADNDRAAAERHARRHVISDSDESDSDEDDTSDSDESELSDTTATPSTSRNTGRAPRRRGIVIPDLTDSDTDDHEDHPEDDESEISEMSDEGPVRPKASGRSNNSTRAQARATIVIDDEEDDETGVSVASEALTNYDTADDMTEASSEAHAMYSHDGPANDVFPDGDDEDPYGELDSDDTAH